MLPTLLQSAKIAAVEISVPCAAAAANAVAWQLRNPSTGRALGLTRLEVILTSAVASRFALLAPTANGAASTSAVGISVGSPVITPEGVAATAWSAAPTLPGATAHRRQMYLAAVLGASVVWTWPENDPMLVGIGESLVLQNVTGGAAGELTVNARWLEFNFGSA